MKEGWRESRDTRSERTVNGRVSMLRCWRGEVGGLDVVNYGETAKQGRPFAVSRTFRKERRSQDFLC